MIKSRIGIYAGTFDPVHGGHLSFALQALELGNIDEVYFLPERKPAYKPGAEHYGHRVAMLRQAIKPYASLAIAEVVERRFSVQRTLPHLQQVFKDSKLVFLMGSDVFTRLPQWQGVDRMVESAEFVVAVRSKDELQVVLATVQVLHIPPHSVHILDSARPQVSSTQMRYAIRRSQHIDGLLMSVEKYARREWLYATVRQSS